MEMVSEPRILRGRCESYSWQGETFQEAEGSILSLAFWLNLDQVILIPVLIIPKEDGKVSLSFRGHVRGIVGACQLSGVTVGGPHEVQF